MKQNRFKKLLMSHGVSENLADLYISGINSEFVREEIMEQRDMQETLNNILWHYSNTYGGDTSWGFDNDHYYIYYDYTVKEWCVNVATSVKCPGIVYFSSYDIAENAIKCIVKPFIKSHPNFII